MEVMASCYPLPRPISLKMHPASLGVNAAPEVGAAEGEGERRRRSGGRDQVRPLQGAVVFACPIIAYGDSKLRTKINRRVFFMPPFAHTSFRRYAVPVGTFVLKVTVGNDALR